MNPASAEYVLAFADDEHLIGHRHTEWIGVAPFLEEDLAFASIGQDELGHGIALYDLVVDDVDHQPFRRTPEEWRSSWLVELPCRDWADALARHWLYDRAERHRWEALRASSVPKLGGIAERALREEEYHRRHADDLVDRLLGGGASEDSRARMIQSLERVLPYAVAVFEPLASEPEALAAGVADRPSAEMASAWRAEVLDALAVHDVDLDWPAPVPGQAGRTARSPDFDALLADLTAVFRLDPDAVW